jgi:hypothetical protein
MKICEGDWVLVDHPYMRESYVVRRVAKATPKGFVGEQRCETRADGVEWVSDGSRPLGKVKGVFSTEALALAATPKIKAFFSSMLAEEKAAHKRFHESVMGLL